MIDKINALERQLSETREVYKTFNDNRNFNINERQARLYIGKLKALQKEKDTVKFKKSSLMPSKEIVLSREEWIENAQLERKSMTKELEYLEFEETFKNEECLKILSKSKLNSEVIKVERGKSEACKVRKESEFDFDEMLRDIEELKRRKNRTEFQEDKLFVVEEMSNDDCDDFMRNKSDFFNK